MSRFANGQIPRNLLVELAPYHWMPAATAVRWKSLVEDIRRNEGVTMYTTPGKNAYRDYEGQVFARNNACAEGRCNDAAVSGTSSHGGEYQGRDSLAIDVANWAEIGQRKWYDYCRKHGFEPGFFDWEPWHIIDWSPWTMPAGGKVPSSTTTRDLFQEDEMPDSMFAVVDGVPSWCWLNWGEGTLYAVHTQKDADWIGSYMGSIRTDFRKAIVNGAPVTDGGGDLYKNKLAMCGILCPVVKINGSSLTEADLARIKALVNSGVTS